MCVPLVSMQSLRETSVGALAGDTAVTFGATTTAPVPFSPWPLTDCKPLVRVFKALPVAYIARAASSGFGTATAASYAAHMLRYAATAAWTAAARGSCEDAAADGIASEGEGLGCGWRGVQAAVASTTATKTLIDGMT